MRKAIGSNSFAGDKHPGKICPDQMKVFFFSYCLIFFSSLIIEAQAEVETKVQ
jgi:hypothetical protein